MKLNTIAIQNKENFQNQKYALITNEFILPKSLISLKIRVLIKKVEYNTDGTNITTLYVNENFIHVINSTGETYNETYYYSEGQLIAKTYFKIEKFISKFYLTVR